MGYTGLIFSYTMYDKYYKKLCYLCIKIGYKCYPTRYKETIDSRTGSGGTYNGTPLGSTDNILNNDMSIVQPSTTMAALSVNKKKKNLNDINTDGKVIGNRGNAKVSRLKRDKAKEKLKNNVGKIETINDYKIRGLNKIKIEPSKRLSGSLAFAIHANISGVQIIRTHDVFETNQALICQKYIDL